MYNNLMELDLLCKARNEEAERKAVLNQRARNVRSWEAQLLERFLHSLSQIRNVHLPPNTRQLNYAAQQE
jgi:hypothetical protein